MNTLTPSEQHANRNNEESLQRTFEAMLTEIRRMKLAESDSKKLIDLLMKYRSAWNSYVNRIKPRQSRADMNSQRKKRSGGST